MKTTLSKSLLCGLMASTFFLANCQKEPAGRSVKAEVGKAGEVNPSDKVSAADKDLNLVLCTPEFLKIYTEYYDYFKTVRTDVNKSEVVTEVRKADLLRLRSDLEEKVKPTQDSLSKLKSDAKTTTGEVKKVDGCFYDASKKKSVTFKKLDDDLNAINLKITELTGEKSARSEAALVTKKAKENEAKKLSQGTLYKVSVEMNELLDEPVSSTSKYFVDGRIAERSDLEADKKNTKAAVCEITANGGKLDSDKLILRSLGDQPAKQENKKIVFSIALGSLANEGDKTYNITCSLPADMKKELGFEKAMGRYLVLQLKSQSQADEAAQAGQLEETQKAKADKITADAEKAKTEAAAAEKAKAENNEEQSGT